MVILYPVLGLWHRAWWRTEIWGVDRSGYTITDNDGTYGGLYIGSSDDKRKGGAPFGDHARNFLPEKSRLQSL